MKKILTSIVVMLAFTAWGTAAFASLLKSPYLIYPANNTQMEVLWQDTTTEANNQVCWGTTTAYGTCQTVLENNATDNQHIYTITGLTPNTVYYYQVSDPVNGVYGTGSFLAAPNSSAKAVNFLGFGDTRTNPTAYDAVMAEMNKFIANNPSYQGLTIHAGDWVSSDGESYWTNEWFNAGPDATAFRLNSPINGCKGNHEDSSGYSTYYPKYYPFPYVALAPKSGSTGVDKPFTNYWYSFDYGPVHFVLADQYSYYPGTTNLDYTYPNSAQIGWLTSDLASAKANPNTPWIILMYHEPAWNCGSHTNNTATQTAFDSLIAANVDMVVAGHSHCYCRAEVWNSAQAGSDSIAQKVPYVTSGGGGAPLGGVSLTNNSSWKHVVVGDNDYNYSTFTVSGKTLTMNTYQVNNASLTTLPSASSPTSSTLIETLVLNQFTDITSQVSAQIGNIVYSRASKTYNGTVTITNNGPALTGNVDIVLNGILALQTASAPGVSTFNPTATDPASPGNGSGTATTVIASNNGLITNVTLLNATGQSNGAPLIQFSTSGLANGASITVPVQFSNPSNVPIIFTPAVLQE